MTLPHEVCSQTSLKTLKQCKLMQRNPITQMLSNLLHAFLFYFG